MCKHQYIIIVNITFYTVGKRECKGIANMKLCLLGYYKRECTDIMHRHPKPVQLVNISANAQTCKTTYQEMYTFNKGYASMHKVSNEHYILCYG